MKKNGFVRVRDREGLVHFVRTWDGKMMRTTVDGTYRVSLCGAVDVAYVHDEASTTQDPVSCLTCVMRSP